MDVQGKTKDDVKARMDMKMLCNRKDLELQFLPNGKIMKPKAKFALSLEQKRSVCQWLKELRMPDGYSSFMANCVDIDGAKISHMKSHDCHLFMETLLPIAFSALPREVWKPLTEISQFFKDLCSTVLRKDKLMQMDANIPLILCQLERNFPPGFFDSMEHLVVHLAYEAILGGPNQYRWMYSPERQFGKWKRTVKNKARVEGCICEAYLCQETSQFCSYYFESHVPSLRTRTKRNENGMSESMVPRSLSVFHSVVGRPSGQSQRRYLTPKERNAAHLHVLINCAEVQPYISRFIQEKREENQYLRNEDIDSMVANEFASWFRDNMAANERRKSSTRGGKNKVPSFSINLSTTQNAQRSSTNPTPSQFQQPVPYTSATIPIHSQFQQPFSYAQNMYSNHPTSSGPHYNMSMPHPEMSSTQPPPGPQDDQSNRNYEETSQGSNANKVYVEPEGKTFYPNPTGVVHCITEIIKSKYDGAWSSWKKIPQEVRLMWFGDFGKRYHWKPEYNQTIRKNFEIRGAARLKDMLAEVREKNQMPGWINPDAWKGLVAYWNTPEFLAKSARNKQNRASDCGGMGASLHTGGSIPATEHKRRLAEKLDREPTLDELFLEIHTRDEGATWVDKRSANAYEKFKKRIDELKAAQSSTMENSVESEESGSGSAKKAKQSIDEVEIWKETVGLNKKGEIYGFGLQASTFKGSSSAGSQMSTQSSAPITETPEFQAALGTVHSQLEGVKKENEALKKENRKLNKKVNLLMEKMDMRLSDSEDD